METNKITLRFYLLHRRGCIHVTTDQMSAKPACAWDDPAAREALVTRLVNDALTILDALDGVVLDDVQAELVGLLALVAGQDVEPGDTDGTWRIARKVSKHRLISTVDPESRHMHKNRSSYRDGYKAHLVAEPDTGIITACALTPANAGDGTTGVTLIAGQAEPVEVYADSAYGTGEMLAALDDAEHTAVIKPWPLRRNPNLGDDQFDRDDYRIDYTARSVTCPAGVTIAFNTAGTAKFKQRCTSCPLRSRCTTARAGTTARAVAAAGAGRRSGGGRSCHLATVRAPRAPAAASRSSTSRTSPKTGSPGGAAAARR